MNKYIVEREISKVGKLGQEQLREAAARSNQALNQLGPDIRWLESFVAADKTFCVYLAKDEAIIHRHAELSGFPASKVTEIGKMIDPMTAVTADEGQARASETSIETRNKTIKDKEKIMKTLIVALVAFASLTAGAQNTTFSTDQDDDDDKPQDFVAPKVFQAAGPTVQSIQSTVDAFRAALGEPNNGNVAGPLAIGRREINWDGGGANTTTAPVTPFNVFLNTRGAQFTTPGTGLSQAPPSGGPQGGLAVLLNNPSYGTIFRAFSPLRLFTPVGSNVTDTLFFLPGSNGAVPATVTGFGAIFTDVDQPDGSKQANRRASTLIRYYGADGRLLFSSFVPASAGDGNFSFLGIVFDDARIAHVRIIAGRVPGANDSQKRDIVMLDDFIYGEPQLLQ